MRDACTVKVAGLLGMLLVFAGMATEAAERGSETLPTDEQLDEIVVLGQYKFLHLETSGITNLPLPLDQIPQSITVVDADFIKAADLKDLADIAEITPGAVNVGNSGGFGAFINLRGFSSANALDGVDFGAVSGANYALDFAILDRVEVIKGPSSVVFGASSAGGLVNFVTKNPVAATPSYVLLQSGSWNAWRLEAQLAGSLDATEKLHGMAVVVQEHGGSFIHDVTHDTTVLYSGINASLGDTASASLHGGYDAFTRTSIDGIPTQANGSPAPVSRAFFVGSPDMKIRTGIYHAESDVSWHPGTLWDVSLKANVINSEGHGVAPYSCCLDPAGYLQLFLTDYLSIRGWDYGVGLSAVYHLDELGLAHGFVSLAALSQYDRIRFATAGTGFAGQPSSSANIFAGEAAVTDAFDAGINIGPIFLTDQTLKTSTLTLQASLPIVGRLSALLGLASVHPSITNLIEGERENSATNDATTHRAALVYEMRAGLNVYAAYSESFNPQLIDDIHDNLLPPLRATQYEAGFKQRIADGGLLIAAAAFDITEKNEGQYVGTIDGEDRYQAFGEVRHQGAEISVLGQVTPQWQISTGYAYLEATILKDRDRTIDGRPQLYVPKHTASLFSSFAFKGGAVAGLSAGGGFRFVGVEHSSYDGSTRDVPGYVLIDSLLAYTKNGWQVQLNGHNIFDKHYFTSTYGSVLYGNTIGAPANVDLTVRRNF